MAPKSAPKDKQTAAAKTNEKKPVKETGAPIKLATLDIKPKETASTTTTAPVTPTTGHGKPDETAYKKEQDDIKKEIDELNKKLTEIKDKIASASKGGPSNERRNHLKAQLDEIRAQQGEGKSSREKTLAQLKATNESVQQKIKDLQSAKTKAPYRSIADLESHVKTLQAQIESGDMKLVEERRAIQEVSNAKRQRRLIEGFDAQQAVIDTEKQKADELRKQLDDPESKAASERYDVIKVELDALKKESDDAYASKSQLFDARNELQTQMDGLYGRKRESAQKYREANDAFYSKLAEDRARRAEKARAARHAAEEEKKQEIVQRLREDADVPAFQAQIEDCQTLIDFFSGTASTSTSGFLPRAAVAAVPELDIRKVDEAISENLVELKKDRDSDDNPYGGATKGKKSKKSGKTSNGLQTPEPTSSTNEKFSISLARLGALSSLSIPAPAGAADVPQTIENLRTKKEWFLANQQKQTAENRAKAEKEIASLLRSINGQAADANGKEVEDAETVAAQEVGPNANPTPAIAA